MIAVFFITRNYSIYQPHRSNLCTLHQGMTVQYDSDRRLPACEFVVAYPRLPYRQLARESAGARPRGIAVVLGVERGCCVERGAIGVGKAVGARRVLRRLLVCVATC